MLILKLLTITLSNYKIVIYSSKKVYGINAKTMYNIVKSSKFEGNF